MTETSHPQTHSQRANSVNVGEHVPRKWLNWLSSFAAWVLTKRGWRVEGELINQKKAILAVAPHTSNWDFFIGLFVVFSFKLNINFFGKHTIFAPLWALLLKD